MTNSFETGYRFRSVGGDYGKYPSDVNYGNGLRLLSSSLTVNSREGRGGWFDEIVLTTLGLGNDPYQSSILRAQKNGIYRYDLAWRLNEYYNPALPVSFGEHVQNTVRRFQDHDLALFPQSSLRLFAGYTRNSQNGPALTTVQQFGPRNDEFPLFADIRRLRNEYRLGGEATIRGVRLNVLHGWDCFSANTVAALGPALATGNNPGDLVTLDALRRTAPYRGSSPYWRASVAAEGKFAAASGRFSYTDGRRLFHFDELATGTGRLGAAQNRQVVVQGDGRRPVATGNLTLSLFPAGRLSLTNHMSFHNSRMEGDAVYREVNNAITFDDLLYFRLLAICAISNQTDLSFQATRWLTLHGGYHYATRRIRSREQLASGGSPEAVAAEQNNRQDAGAAGVRLRPAKLLGISLDAEIGRSDRPVFSVSDRDYHALGGRIQYKTRTVQVSASTRASYNINSAALSAHSSRGRNHSLDGSWTARSWLAVEGGYSKIHLDTVSGLAYFATTLVMDQRSYYFSNLHAAHGGVRVGLGSRCDFWLGYTRVQDTGGGRLVGDAVFPAAQAFPLTYESPMARFSLRLSNRLC